MNYKYFTDRELFCPCCDFQGMQPSFMHKIELLREACEFPFIVTSAFRCVSYNEEIGGAKNSAHLLGQAMDIKVSHEKAFKLVSLAPQFGFTGIGVSQKGPKESRFIHLDNVPRHDPTVPRPRIWSY